MVRIQVERTTLTTDEQIRELNSQVKCYIGPSSIHGVGVFALRDLMEGEKLYCTPMRQPSRWYSVSYGNIGKLFPEIKEMVLSRYASIINGSLFQSPNDDVWLVLFLNHSDDSNYDHNTDLAKRNIAKGEEITQDYRLMTRAREIYTWLK